MDFPLKGNYFHGSFSMPPIGGSKGVEQIIKKFSPANTTHHLWDGPVDFRHVEPAVESAEHGHLLLQKKTLEERIEIVMRLHEQVEVNRSEIETAIALETGKPLHDAKCELDTLQQQTQHLIQVARQEIATQQVELNSGVDANIYYRPLGISLIISSSFLPILQTGSDIVSTILAGNSFILKPSEKVMFSSQLLIESIDQAGLPNGVANMLQGPAELTQRILRQKEIRVVLFYGSSENGLSILQNASIDPTKQISLHLGAKNSTIVHQDAKLEPTLINLLYSAFSSAGQNALSTSLVAIHRSIHQDFISQFHKLAKKIVIDHPIEHEHEPFMGPLIDQQAVDNYLLYMGMAKREGIEEIMRGKQLSKRYPGHYVSPAIHLTDCDHTDSHFLSNEIIGPVCTFLVYDEIEQAINLVNSSQYGLVTSLFTSDKNIQQRCIETICSANINLNLPTTFQRFSLPIMGIKQSGNYHPGGSGTIRQSVYPLSCLESNSLYENNLEPIKRGINYDN